MTDPLARYQIGAPIPRVDESVIEAFRAVDSKNGAAVVLEVVRAGATSVEKARFGTRARRLATVEHPSLAGVVDVGPTHCAVESPAGTPLTEHAHLAIDRARLKLSWLARLMGALAALHKGGFVHGRVGLDAMIVPEEGPVKLTVHVGSNVGGSPTDDVRAFGASACRLFLGEDVVGHDERKIGERLVDAGLPGHPSAILARVCVGRSTASADLAEELAPFVEVSGPSTERLLPVSPRR